MTAETRAQLIRKYRDGCDAVVAALEGISADELDRAPEGEWTPRQIVHHLADGELTRDRPIEASLQSIRWIRESTTQLLERMSEDEWTKAGEHDERGRYTAADWLAGYAPHAHDHAEQIKQVRRR